MKLFESNPITKLTEAKTFRELTPEQRAELEAMFAKYHKYTDAFSNNNDHMWKDNNLGKKSHAQRMMNEMHKKLKSFGFAGNDLANVIGLLSMKDGKFPEN